MTSIKLAHIAGPKVRSFLTRIDRARNSNRNGIVTNTEAAQAARSIKKNYSWKKDSIETFGRQPKSGADILRLASVHLKAPTSTGSTLSRTSSGSIDFGDAFKGKSLQLTKDGQLRLNGKGITSRAQLSRALQQAATLLSSNSLEGINISSLRSIARGINKQLESSLKTSPTYKSSKRLYASSMSILLSLALRAKASGSTAAQNYIGGLLVQGLEDQRGPTLRTFYFGAISQSDLKLRATDIKTLKELNSSILPTHPPVDKYTKNRSRPLGVQHTIHHEFWKDETSFYSKENGWKLISKNTKDTKRVYEGTFEDPTGKNIPLKVKTTVSQGHMDFLSEMNKSKTNLIIYSGHSALGGNGSQSIDEAPQMRGVPKTVVAFDCRGKDNYAEFVDRFPEAMLITTKTFTYGDPENRRIRALYETFVQSESFESLRKKVHFKLDNEPADNYFFPHQRQSFAYADRDADGKIDTSAVGTDTLFNVDDHENGLNFVRAINFVNSEYYYHWQIPHENGKKSTFNKTYTEAVFADGPIENPEPGEVVRVQRVSKSGSKKAFKVQYNPNLSFENRDVLAAVVMAHTATQISKTRFRTEKSFEALRGIIMGAQAAHYLNVYTSEDKPVFTTYLEAVGLKGLDYKKVDALFSQFDGHANNDQVKAFAKLIKEETDVNPGTFTLPPLSPNFVA